MREHGAATQKYGIRVSVLSGWRHCPRCASELTRREECVECTACEFIHYAQSAPAVAAFVVDEAGRVLLTRRAHEPDAELWDSPGGFLLEGEDPFVGLRRELKEETGLSVEPGAFVGTFIDTYGVEPDAPSVLNLVWEAHVTGGDPAPADDVTELRWFGRDELPHDDDLAFTWLAPTLRDWIRKKG
jgi:ADP-ribose pyrophosphatase YjhB (NUDIX family)